MRVRRLTSSAEANHFERMRNGNKANGLQVVLNDLVNIALVQVGHGATGGTDDVVVMVAKGR